MSMLTRDQMLGTLELRRVLCRIPDYGDVYVRELTGGEFEKFEDREGKPGGRFGYLAAVSCVDAEGKQMFKLEEAVQLIRMPGRILKAIMETSIELNGFTDDVAEELAGNSESDQPEDSGSS